MVSGAGRSGAVVVVVAETMAGGWSGTSTMDEVEATGMGVGRVAETFFHVCPVRWARHMEA